MTSRSNLSRTIEQLKPYLWRNRFLILSSLFLLGSWISQNFFQANWSSEKQRLFNFLTFQEIIYNDMAQWQLAANNLEQHIKETTPGDSINYKLNYHPRYAQFCLNWLQMFYDYINLSHEMTEPDMRKRMKKQKKLADTISYFQYQFYHNRNLPFISLQYNIRVRQAESVAIFNSWLVRQRLRKIETNENRANVGFLVAYIIGTILLACNFTYKGLKDQKQKLPPTRKPV